MLEYLLFPNSIELKGQFCGAAKSKINKQIKPFSHETPVLSYLLTSNYSTLHNLKFNCFM